MTTNTATDSRDVVPRWRQWRYLQTFNEFNPVRLIDKSGFLTDSWFDSAFKSWEASKDIGTAADAFSAASIEGIYDARSKSVAEFLKKHREKISDTLHELAVAYLKNGLKNSSTYGLKELPIANKEVLYRETGYLRKRLRAEPRNGLLWHDLSWCYAVLGEHEKAERSMRSAIQVNGESRFIRRSASRFFVNTKDYQSALQVIAKAENVKKDPWLVSAHLATSRAANKNSQYRKLGKQILEDAVFKPVELSELSAALATEEYYDGKRRILNKYVNQSLIQPTDNTLAQVVWLGKELKTEFVESKVIRQTTASFEAAARQAYTENDWKRSVSEGLKWLQDEPYSTESAAFGSFVASTFLDDFVIAKKFADIGVQANPDSFLLRNNLIVSLCELNDLPGALRESALIKVPARKDRFYATWLATSGLIQYRLGEIENARALYDASRDELQKKNNTIDEILSVFYQAREEIRIRDFQRAKTLLQRAKLISKGARGDMQAVIDILDRALSKK